MATSKTIYGIINDAMHDAGYLEEGEVPNSEQLASNFRRLNDIINLWQTQGLKLFLLQDITLPLVADQHTYTFGPDISCDVVMAKPSRVIDAYVLTPDGIRRPLIPIAWKDWNLLPQVTGNSGIINSYMVDKQAEILGVRFWNSPDATEALNSVVLTMQVAAPNAINLEQSMNFPQEWRIALRWGLADDIATGQPQAIMERCAERAAVYRAALEDWDVEDAPTNFAPSTRTGYGVVGRFK
jgi:hypothetical protein